MIQTETKFKETEVGLIPEDWEVLKIKKIANVYDSLHQTPKYSINGYPMVRVTDIKPGSLDLNNTLKVDENVFKAFTKKYCPQKEDIVVSRVGSYGIFSRVSLDEKFCLGQNTAIINPKINSRYLYYFLSSLFTREQVESFVGGSTQKTLSLEKINDISVVLPPKEEQQKIADVLGALDEKIELNRKMNKTLESIGQAIFKEWFIDNADPNWETKKLGDLLTIDRGLSYKGKYLNDDGTPMFNLGSFNVDGSLKLDTLKYYVGDFKASNTVESGDIIVANTDMTQNRAILGSACLIPDLFDNKIIFTHHVYALRIGNKIDVAFIYNLLKTRDFKDQAVGFATGTTVLFLPKEAISNYETFYPNKEKLEEFNNIFVALTKKQEILIKGINSLSQIRDSLLPRLMSGKLRVR